ncbi:hypothetical protein [Paenibacillus aceris]|uniref:Uncharacterized protein n=1 Tax=Paenibacillus aceris TaxID=869555 RepID=A0ABS4I2E4_9BACL|nr:hypothetical protein [Paenibacillus aceris]MBP1964736.1 hypothetical protein [Paenibacillus aceris]NHW33722.1 hypothetical protein [Paenibacillus aceris]
MRSLFHWNAYTVSDKIILDDVVIVQNGFFCCRQVCREAAAVPLFRPQRRRLNDVYTPQKEGNPMSEEGGKKSPSEHMPEKLFRELDNDTNTKLNIEQLARITAMVKEYQGNIKSHLTKQQAILDFAINYRAEQENMEMKELLERLDQRLERIERQVLKQETP